MKNKSFIAPFLYFLAAYLLSNILLRIIFIYHPITTSSFSFEEVLAIFSLGLLQDMLVYIIAFALFFVYQIGIDDAKYKKPYGQILFAIGIIVWIWVSFTHTIFNDYGGVVPEIVISLLTIKVGLFGLCLFLPTKRTLIRQINYVIALFLFSVVLVMNCVSEYFFYNEFGARYNFIAVDYLVYTNEVIGNMLESYPVIPLFTGVFLLSGALCWFVYNKTKQTLVYLPKTKNKLIVSGIYIALFIIALVAIKPLAQQNKQENVFASEIEKNGLHSFETAFNSSMLDYFKFYITLDEQTLKQNLQPYYPQANQDQFIVRQIKAKSAIQKKNVVLISLESMSADFMSYYHNDKKLTPFLDSLAAKSLFFTNLYATGNRTVRGLEAMTMCIVPSPGESVVKRKDNKDKFTTGSVFADQGYKTNYLYGGDAYFDNMRDFFSGNNYRVIDKKDFSKEQITFENIWGVCDTDMVKKAVEVMNQDYQSGQPFFTHMMSVSNHRPFTYPDNAVYDLDLDSPRDKGVRYTDQAVKEFFELAKKQPWYDNTIFVILSDHCASSAGKTELPLDKYRIIGMIYDPTQQQGKAFDSLMSQIDVMPTLLGILNFDYTSKFMGTDVLEKNYIPRAFIATYQDLGFIKDNTLTVLGANSKLKQYDFDSPQNNSQLKIKLNKKQTIDKQHANLAVSFYQTTARLLADKQYDK